MTGVRYYHVFYLISGFLHQDPIRSLVGHNRADGSRVGLVDRNFGSRFESLRDDLSDYHCGVLRTGLNLDATMQSLVPPTWRRQLRTSKRLQNFHSLRNGRQNVYATQ